MFLCLEGSEMEVDLNDTHMLIKARYPRPRLPQQLSFNFPTVCESPTLSNPLYSRLPGPSSVSPAFRRPISGIKSSEVGLIKSTLLSESNYLPPVHVRTTGVDCGLYK